MVARPRLAQSRDCLIDRRRCRPHSCHSGSMKTTPCIPVCNAVRERTMLVSSMARLEMRAIRGPRIALDAWRHNGLDLRLEPRHDDRRAPYGKMCLVVAPRCCVPPNVIGTRCLGQLARALFRLCGCVPAWCRGRRLHHDLCRMLSKLQRWWPQDAYLCVPSCMCLHV